MHRCIDLPPWPAASFILTCFSLTLMACSRSKIKSCASSMPTDSLTQHGQGASSLHFQEYLEILKTSSRTKLHVEEFMLLEKHDWIEDIESFLWLLSISISNVFKSHEKASETTIFHESNWKPLNIFGILHTSKPLPKTLNMSDSPDKVCWQSSLLCGDWGMAWTWYAKTITKVCHPRDPFLVKLDSNHSYLQTTICSEIKFDTNVYSLIIYIYIL